MSANEEEKVLTPDMANAVINGDLLKVQELFKEPSDLLATVEYGLTSIYLAVENGHLNILQYLLEIGGKIDFALNFYETPLYFACMAGNFEIIEWLLKNGAKPESNLNTYVLSSYEEKKEKNMDIVKILFEYSGEHWRDSVTGMSFQMGDVEVAKLCVEHGVDLYKRRDIYNRLLEGRLSEYTSPLTVAIRGRGMELIRYLVGIGIDFKDHQKLGFDCFALACSTNNLDYIRFIWETIYDKQLTNHAKSKSMHSAALEYEMPVLDILLGETGCSLEQLNDYEETPLLSSIIYDKLKQAQHYIGIGADVNAKRFDGQTALHLYCQHVREAGPLLEAILTSVDNINSTDSKKRTPLHYAALEGSKEVIKYLVKSGADKNATDIYNATALHYLSGARKLMWDRDAFDCLVTDFNHELLDEKRRTPLHYAAENGSVECVKALIEHGSNIFAESDEKGTALHHALAGGHWSNALHLMSLGADINALNKLGKIPLHYSAWSVNMLEALLDKGANLHAKDNNGQTVLHLACQFNEDYTGYNNEGYSSPCETVAVLLERGSDVNATDKLGRTPLLFAYKRPHKELIEMLLSHGAENNPVDNEGKNILHYAALSNSTEFLKSVFDDSLNVPDKNGHRPLFYACDDETVNYLFEHTDNTTPGEFSGYFPRGNATLGTTEGYLCIRDLKIDIDIINTIDENGNNLLHKYARGFDEDVKYLLRKGVDINARNKDLWTPLHFSVDSEDSDCLKFLVEHGADVEALNNENKTAFDLAREKEKRHEEMVSYLAAKMKSC